MAQPVHPHVWTEADLDSLPDDGHRYEILGGRLLVTPPPGGPHQYIGDQLRGLLHAAAPPGWHVVTAIGLRVPDGNLIPDVVVLRPAADLTVWHEYADAALVAEVASPSTVKIDRGAKAAAYAAAGIASYWRVERDGTLIVRELVDNEYRVVATVAPGESWTAAQPFEVTVEPSEFLW